MKIDIHDPSQLLSHVLLGDLDVVKKVSNTTFWKDDKQVVARVLFNDVEVPAEVFENILYELFDRHYQTVREQYDAPNIDAMVEARAREILKTDVGALQEKLYALANAIEQVDDMIVPYWERSEG